MTYIDLLNNGASPTEMRAFLVDGNSVPLTMRIPELLKRGETVESILSKIDKYPTTESLKCTLRCKLAPSQS